MKFSEFKHYRPKQPSNVFVFICEDAYLLEESMPVWRAIFGGEWVFEKYPAKEFEEIAAGSLMDSALTPSLFTQNRVLLVTNAEKVTKARIEVLIELQSVEAASLRVVLCSASGKVLDSLGKTFPGILIDPLKAADVARWLTDRYKIAPDIARYLVDNVGLDLYQLRNEMQKLETYVGKGRAIEVKDVDVLILRTEQFGPFELDDALLARNYGKAVQVVGSMLDEGSDPLIILSRVTRVWRQLFVGKSVAGKTSAKDAAAAAGVPSFKAADFVTSCRKFDWKQLVSGFQLLLNADRAFKTSTPNPEGYFDVMLWKMLR